MNILTAPFKSYPGFIILTLLQLVLPISWILVNIGRQRKEDFAELVWYTLGLGLAVSTITSIAILISSIRRQGRWPIRWGGIFLIWSFFTFLAALGLNAAFVEGQAHTLAYFERLPPKDSSPYEEERHRNQVHWGIANLTVGAVTALFTLYYSVGLFTMRKTLPQRICSPSSDKFETILDEESVILKSNNGESVSSSSCGRRVQCCCCQMDSGCRFGLIFMSFLIASGIAGGFSVLVLMAGFH